MMKEESEKAGLKHNVQNTKIDGFSPITSWQTEGERAEAVLIPWAKKKKKTKPMHIMTAALKLKDACYLEGKL